MSEQEPIDYNSEPVKYCSRCYSLKIKYEESIDSEYCDECGCSDIMEAPIEEWETLYERRYHHKYVTDVMNIRNTPIFKATGRELKKLLFKLPSWKDVIRQLYHRFPKGLSKEDAILLLFDKLIKDNRLDDLKYILVKRQNKLNYGRAEESKNERS